MQKVTRQEQHKEKEQASIYKHSLLPRSQCITTQSKLLILCKPRNLHTLALKEAPGRPARRAPPVIGQFVELQPWRYGVGWVTSSLIILIPTRPAFINSGVQHRELLFQTAFVEILRLLGRRIQGGC